MNRGIRYVCAAAAAAARRRGCQSAARARLEAQPRGKNVYDTHCVECHGDVGSRRWTVSGVL